jgi:hypothetical protein
MRAKRAKNRKQAAHRKTAAPKHAPKYEPPNIEASPRLWKWATGKSPIFVIIALTVASAAEELHDGIKFLTSGQRLPDRMPDPPDLATWLNLYRDNNRMWDVVGAACGLPSEGEFTATNLSRWWRKLCRLSEEERNAAYKTPFFEQITEAIKAIMPPAGTKIHVDKELTSYVKDEDDDTPDEVMAEVTALPEIQFFLRVWLPCYIEYRQYPSKLFASARRDKGQVAGPDRLVIPDALDKLLRIDKSVLADPRIAAHWHASAHARSKARMKRLAKAIAGRPPGNCTIQKTKRGLVGLVAEFAKICRQEITEPELRELFDLVAEIRHNRLRDDHLSPQSWTLAKSIQRERAIWQLLLDPDKLRP